MNITTENILLIGSILLFVSVVVGKTSYRFGVPTLLLFLGVGMLAGTDGLVGISFDDSKIAQFIGIVALNFILFSGGLDTSFQAVRPVLLQGLVLSTLGVLLTAVTLGLFVYWAVGSFTLYESLLLGSIVSSTDAAAVFSILRAKNMALKTNLRPTLELESGSNDPMAYVLTIAFLSLVVNQEQSFWSIIPFFFKQMILGGLSGFGFGKLSKFVINKIKLDFEGLYPVLAVTLMFITFSTTEFVGGNGFLAIYVCALYLGNQDFIHKKTVLKFFDGLAWLMQIVLFLTLGLLVTPSQIVPYLGIGLLISVFLIVVARPISVFISTAFFKMKTRRRLYISWVGLRGAVPIVFATYPLLAGIEKANMIFNIVFFISVTSVLIQGTTLSLVAKWLHVALPEKVKKFNDVDKFILNLPKSVYKEFKILKNSSAIGKQIVDLHFPKSAFIVMIKRGSVYIRPGGSTVIEQDDLLMILADDEKDYQNVEQCIFYGLD
jgi:cell volume regulation protein A